MRDRGCEHHDNRKEGCGACTRWSWGFEVVGSVVFILLSTVHFCNMQLQISEVCGSLGNRTPECMVDMPTKLQVANPAYLHMWNLDSFKLYLAEGGSSGMFDLALFTGAIILIIVGLIFLSNKIRNYLKFDGIKSEFKEKELRMRLSADYEDKAKAVESRHKQLTAPSADPSIWETVNESEEIFVGEVV